MRTFLVLLTAILFVVPACLQAPPNRDAEVIQTGDPSARPQTGGSPDVPTWTVNDHWVLRTHPQDDPNETVEVADEFVQAIDILHSDGADMDAFRVVSQEKNRTTWYRMSDLALMKEEWMDAEGSHEVVYERPCALYHWPLEVNITWYGDCARGDAGVLNFTATVEAEEMVSVPTGNFSTFRIHYTGVDNETPFERTEYFSPNACFSVRTITDDEDRTLVRDLISYQCTAAGAP